ncbi:MAG: arginine deiminase family protein, partial [Emergencia timonensis]
MYPSQVPYSVVDAMKKKSYRILECPDTRECKEGFGVNFVAIRPGEIVMPAGNDRSREILESNGVKVHVVEYDEVVKAWGGMHCCTAFLKRG